MSNMIRIFRGKNKTEITSEEATGLLGFKSEDFAAPASGLLMGLAGFIATSNPLVIPATVVGSIGASVIKRQVQELIESSVLSDAFSAAIDELESRARDGVVLRSDLADTEGGYREIVEELIKQIYRDSQAKKRIRLGKMIARAAEESNVPWSLIHSLLKSAPDLTYEDMFVIKIFREEEEPWLDRDLNNLEPVGKRYINKLRSMDLLTPVSGGFEGNLSITESGKAMYFLLALEDNFDHEDEFSHFKERFDLLEITSDYRLEEEGIGIHVAQVDHERENVYINLISLYPKEFTCTYTVEFYSEEELIVKYGKGLFNGNHQSWSASCSEDYSSKRSHIKIGYVNGFSRCLLLINIDNREHILDITESVKNAANK